jgi:hypothetical protein
MDIDVGRAVAGSSTAGRAGSITARRGTSVMDAARCEPSRPRPRFRGARTSMHATSTRHYDPLKHYKSRAHSRPSLTPRKGLIAGRHRVRMRSHASAGWHAFTHQRVSMFWTFPGMLMPGRRKHGTRFTAFRRALELLRIHDRLRHGCEDGMRRHWMEPAGRLNFGRTDRLVVRAEIDGPAADAAR